MSDLHEIIFVARGPQAKEALVHVLTHLGLKDAVPVRELREEVACSEVHRGKLKIALVCLREVSTLRHDCVLTALFNADVGRWACGATEVTGGEVVRAWDWDWENEEWYPQDGDPANVKLAEDAEGIPYLVRVADGCPACTLEAAAY